MRLIKAILRQGVDIGMFLIMTTLLVWYIINPEKNFTGALLLASGYIAFNTYMKALYSERFGNPVEKKTFIDNAFMK